MHDDASTPTLMMFGEFEAPHRPVVGSHLGWRIFSPESGCQAISGKASHSLTVKKKHIKKNTNCTPDTPP